MYHAPTLILSLTSNFFVFLFCFVFVHVFCFGFVYQLSLWFSIVCVLNIALDLDLWFDRQGHSVLLITYITGIF